MKVSGALKSLIKKIIYIKNQNLEADKEQEMLATLRDKHVMNYHKAMGKYMKDPWSRLLK